MQETVFNLRGSRLHCQDCGRAGCCHKEAPHVVRITVEERGYIKGWSTDHRSGSEPCDLESPKSIVKALERLVQFLTNGQAAYVHFDN